MQRHFETGTERPALSTIPEITKAEQQSKQPNTHESCPRKHLHQLANKIRKWLKRDMVIVHVAYGWTLWEVKRAGSSVHKAVLTQRYKIRYKTRYKRWSIKFKLWEYMHMLEELLALMRWKVDTLLWHIRNGVKKGRMALAHSRNTNWEKLKHQRREMAAHSSWKKCIGNPLTAVFVCEAICTKSIDGSTRLVMVPFWLYAWVCGYWSSLFEEVRKWEAKTRRSAE